MLWPTGPRSERSYVESPAVVARLMASGRAGLLRSDGYPAATITAYFRR
jgi:hypothetical protein